MDTVMDEVDIGIDPEAEVRKLQDLVKKLERQNQILRSKQNRDPVIPNTGTEEYDVSLSKQNRTKATDADTIKDGFKNFSLEEVDLVDVENVTAEDDEETWLFESPKKLSPVQTTVSPYKWLRKEFEHPSPEVDTARRSLLFKLDDVSRGKSMSRSSSAGTLGSLTSPTAPGQYPGETTSLSSHGASPASTLPNSSPAARLPTISGLGSRVNTGTFTRPKKHLIEKKDPELIDDCNTSYLNTGTFTRPKKLSPRQPQPDLLDDLECAPIQVNTGTFTRPRRHKPSGLSHSADELDDQDTPDSDTAPYDVTSEVSDAGQSRLHEHRFSDVTSLQVVARMQEESLRQSFSSPLMSPRRSLRLTRTPHRTETHAGIRSTWLSQDEIHHASSSSSSPHYYSSKASRNSPGRFYVNPEEYKSKCLSKDSLASTASSHSNSNTSSPPNSPYGSQYLDQKPQVSETHRRSLPNLARSLNQGSLQTYQSDNRLQPRQSPPRSLQKPSSMSRRARNPGSGARQSSPGRTLSPGSPSRTLSPGRSGIPTPRSSGIPRPGGSKLPQPRKSGIPSPRRASNASRADDSWKEGCY